MNKNEGKKLDLNELDSIEKEFAKTAYGKFMRVIVIMALVAIVIGWLGIPIFETIIHVRNLDINKYQTIIDFGKSCAGYGGKSLLFSMFFYAGVLPAMMKDKKKDEKSTKKSNTTLTILVLTIFTLCMAGPMLKLVTEICALIW